MALIRIFNEILRDGNYLARHEDCCCCITGSCEDYELTLHFEGFSNCGSTPCAAPYADNDCSDIPDDDHVLTYYDTAGYTCRWRGAFTDDGGHTYFVQSASGLMCVGWGAHGTCQCFYGGDAHPCLGDEATHSGPLGGCSGVGSGKKCFNEDGTITLVDFTR